METDYLKNWSTDDLRDEHDRTIDKVKEVLQEQKHLNSLLASLQNRSATILVILDNRS